MVAPLSPGLVGTAVRRAGGLLVGREREIAVLTEALSGGARSCVVHGATGMGKSALLSVASSIAVRSGLRPVRGLRALSGVDSHTVLVVDDAERLCAEEADRLARFRGAVVLAGDCDPDVLAVVDAVRVPLRPIDAEAVAEMIRRRFDTEVPPELAALCLEYSGGAPGVLSDVLDVVTDLSSLRAVLPGVRLPRLLRAVRRNWEVLDADAVAVARALAVLGSASLDVLCEVAGMGSFRTLAAFERLVDARLADGDPMRVRSPALSHAIRHEMTPESRESLHRTAAEVTHRRCDPPVAVAEHVVACAEPVGARWVAPLLHGAARLHQAAGRPEQAVRCLRAALREPVEGEIAEHVAVAMAELHLRCGIAPRADELARQRPAAGEWFDAVVLDWQCDEDLLGHSAAPVVPEDPERALRDLPESGPLIVPLALAGLGLLRRGSERVVLDLAPQLRVRLVGAERDWLTALEMWAHRAGGAHAEVSRLMRELAQASPLRGCVALGAAAFVASCADAGRPGEAREMLVRLGYTGTLPPVWTCVLLLHQRARMHLALGTARAALADAERAGAAELADQARAALGREHRPPRGAAWDRLTPHESRIVLLVLEGETNRSIAARFNVTQRAVELHLTRVYRKVGISRRVQLSSVFGTA
ncbi:helix-turn-helix transcriptional regulator [Lentzea flaviverrucosa]|uniref:Regulatory protein, luxR family n=1 Tax=Lentzea flaviverrucosa TaxID=200379 RepID=A0A1H9WN42_9PSEU|nr:LuxR family transcriptional regulator [Lentzea flaviverrucosa]RDI22935.1 regulatory LuxR family protein [Lentzea flaviverrucosa]SES35189.1 regulatory protein, luxR family [Lentzea flaviverrucosa]